MRINYVNKFKLLFILLLTVAIDAFAEDIQFLIQPPDVPNPWNVSEGRAIRDYLLEKYNIKVGNEVTDQEAKLKYSRLWNDEQRNLFENGNNCDKLYKEKFLEYLDKKKKDELIETGRKIGLELNEMEEIESMKAKIKEKEEMIKTEKIKKEKSELERISQGIEVKKKEELKSDNIKIISLAKENAQFMSEDYILKKYILLNKKNNLTKSQEVELVEKAQRFLARLKNIRKEFRLTAREGDLEVYVRSKITKSDNEKMNVDCEIINMSDEHVRIKNIKANFINSVRNKSFYEYKFGESSPTGLINSCSIWSSDLVLGILFKEVYFDKEQIMILTVETY